MLTSCLDGMKQCVQMNVTFSPAQPEGRNTSHLLSLTPRQARSTPAARLWGHGWSPCKRHCHFLYGLPPRDTDYCNTPLAPSPFRFPLLVPLMCTLLCNYVCVGSTQMHNRDMLLGYGKPRHGLRLVTIVSTRVYLSTWHPLLYFVWV